MSRWLSWLSELQPEMFCEVSPALAAEKGLTNGGWATISTARGEIEARVLVTERIPALKIRGRTIHQIGLPYHWGSIGLSTGDPASELIAFVAEPNVSIQESKALTGNIETGRRRRKAKMTTDDRRRSAVRGPRTTPLRTADGGSDPQSPVPDPQSLLVSTDAAEENARDLDNVTAKPQGIHGLRAGERKQTEQS
jgi:formate dehydrogenase major subunit